jgi:hypothetical protein
MGKRDDHIGPDAEDSFRTLDSMKPMYEPGSHIRCYKLLSVPAAEDTATANGVEASQSLYVNSAGTLNKKRILPTR